MKIVRHLCRENLLHKVQHSFVTGLTNVIGMFNLIAKLIVNDDDVNISCLDLSHGFDIISYRIIGAKLADLEVSSKMVNWVWISGRIVRSSFELTPLSFGK